MLMPASAEYVTLCQSQVQLLVQGFRASMIAVYLTEEFAGDQQAELVPVVLYPEEFEPRIQALPMAVSNPDVAMLMPDLVTPTGEPPAVSPAPAAPPSEQSQLARSPASQAQLMLPLMQDEVVLGLLVVTRDQPWSNQERAQLQRVAETLAIACVIDQRSQWLASSQFQQRALQAQQHKTLSNLLHQFRSPLTALRTLGKLLSKRFQTDANNRQLAESIVQQSDRLEELLQQFDGAVDLGEAALEAPPTDTDSGGIFPELPKSLPPASDALTPLAAAELRLQPCWVADILDPLLVAELGVIDERHMSLETDIPAELPPVKADASSLREVLSNLVDNALKYTPAGGAVRVQVEQLIVSGQSMQSISVSDSGPGIPHQDLEQVFERHYRGVQAHTDIPGTGLGLAIARNLIQQMQGDIQAFSPAIDGPVTADPHNCPGSTFRVLLPEC